MLDLGSNRPAWVATGVGSLPGTDPGEAAAIVAGELPDWPHLVELPARGPGADMVGRAFGLICELAGEFAVEPAPSGWRRADRPGRYMRRAQGMLRDDLDALAERLQGYAGPLGVPLAGPWTLAASVLDRWGERAIRDDGYTSALREAHAEAAARLVARVTSVLPAARPVLTVDEPMLAAVRAGSLPFTSGYRRHRPRQAQELAAGLLPVRDAARGAAALFGIHSCAPPVWPVFESVAPDWLGLDLALVADEEPLGAWLESGRGLIWGVWPTSGPADGDAVTRLVAQSLHRLGLSGPLPGPMAIAPTCGLAGLESGSAIAALRGCRRVAQRLASA